MIRIQLPDGSHADFDTTDPRAAARAAQRVVALKASQGAARNEPSIPEPVRSVGNAINDFSGQVGRSLGVGDELAGAAGYVTQGARNLMDRAQGRPIQMSASDAGLASAAYDRQRGDEYAQRHPIANAAAAVGGFAAAGKPSIGANMQALPMPRVNPFKAGAETAGVVAPFALAQQEGELPDRAVKAAPIVAFGGMLGTGAQALANKLSSIAANSQLAHRAWEFEKAMVPPTMAALMSGETSLAPGLTKAISENFWMGGNARQNLANSNKAVGASAQRLAGEYGQAQSPLLAGERVMSGVDNFAGRQGTFRTKAKALFDTGLRPIAGQKASTTTTQQTLADIMGRVQGPASSEIIIPQQMQKIAKAINDDAGKLTLGDLREWRTWVRAAQDSPDLAQTIDNASLQRLESALTTDIYGNAYRVGGPRAFQQLRQADRYYAAGMQRIQSALKPFADPKMRGESAYDRIIQMASERRNGAGPLGNTRALVSLKRSLSADDWSTVSSTILSRLGKPKAGSPNAMADDAFSVSEFVTNYNRLSPEGRQALFGGLGGGGDRADSLIRELNNLAKVANYNKSIEAMANGSRSGVSMQNVTVSPFNPAAWPLLMGGSITGEMMTNPAFVRWLSSAPTATGPGGAIAHAQKLEQLVARDPALTPAYEALREKISEMPLWRSRFPPQRPGDDLPLWRSRFQEQ